MTEMLLHKFTICVRIFDKLSYSQFCLKFRCHGNKGRSEVNLDDPVELAVPENHTLEPKITNLSCI